MTEPVADEFTEERWVFLGEFAGDKIKRIAKFRDANGTVWTLPWKPLHNRLAVGYIYTAMVSAETVRQNYGWTGETADDSAELRLQDRHRATQRESARVQEKARKGDPELERVLEVVRDYAAPLIKTSSRDALIALLTREVYRAHR